MDFLQQTKGKLLQSGFTVFDGFCDREITVGRKELFAFVYSGEGETDVCLSDLSANSFRFRRHRAVIEAYSDNCSVLSLDRAIDGFLRELSYTGKIYITSATVSSPCEDKEHSRFKRKIVISANELTEEGKAEA